MRTLIAGLLLTLILPFESAHSSERVQSAQNWKSQMGRTSLILEGTAGKVELNDVQVELKEVGSQINLRIRFGLAHARSTPGELARTLTSRWTDFEHPMAEIELNGKKDKKMSDKPGYITLMSQRTPFKVQGLTLSRAGKHPLVPSRSERKIELSGVFESSGADPAGRIESWSMRLEGWLEK